MIFLFKEVIFRFYVSFPGCTVPNFRNSLEGIGGFGSVGDRHGSEVGSCPISPGIPAKMILPVLK